VTLHLEHFLAVGAVLFSLGLVIALSKRNAIGVLMGVELMLNAVNITLLAFARFADAVRTIEGATFVVFVLTVAAAEAAVALALAVSVYRNRESIDVDSLNELKL
jgi:NADH:ubiquinone oxidoreductase subunit K